ncbi:MAG: phosphoribosylformylglycinamidine synthase, partial [Acutalibacteraceae bacterium]
MVYRLFVEKKEGLQNEAASLKSEINKILQIKGLEKLRIFNRYDVENIDKALFDYCKKTVFSEPQLDDIYDELSIDSDYVFAVEYLPGQFDQRANSASECIQLISKSERPDVKTAK